MNARDNLAVKAAVLAKLMPVEWDEFMKAFDAYKDYQRDMLVASPVEGLPTSQGVARGVAALFDMFVECKSTVDKVQRK